MTLNLIAELVKMGVPARKIAKEIAKTLEINEKTARNKLNGVTAFTFPEAVKINNTRSPQVAEMLLRMTR